MQRNHMAMATLALSTLVLCLGAGLAQAQANPELGETGGSAQVGAGGQVGTGAPQGTWQPPTQNQPTADTTTTTPTDTTTQPEGTDDHSGVVGTFGIGLVGVTDVPVLACGGGGPACPATATSISAPTLGMRYWLNDGMAIEAGLGFAITSGGTTITPPAGAAVDNNDPSYVAFVLHGGLPLALAHAGHFTFEVIPELNFGIASGSWDDTSAANADVDLGGLLFQLGARAGAEIQFGFIGIPQLSLQGTIGAHLSLENRSATLNGAGGKTDFSQSSFRFGTNLQGEPWDIFTGAISALYYF